MEAVGDKGGNELDVSPLLICFALFDQPSCKAIGFGDVEGFGKAERVVLWLKFRKREVFKEGKGLFPLAETLDACGVSMSRVSRASFDSVFSLSCGWDNVGKFGDRTGGSLEFFSPLGSSEVSSLGLWRFVGS